MGATCREGREGVGSWSRSRCRVRPGEGQRPRAGELCGEQKGAAVTMAPGGEGVTRALPGVPRGSRFQMVPGLPREPAACGWGRLLSSFRGAAVPPLAPARRHAPRRHRQPRASPAPRDSACPPPAVRPAAARPPVAARNRPSWPGCGRGDDRCAPARRAPACGAGAPPGGRCRRPGRFVPAGGAVRFVSPRAGAWDGVGVRAGRGSGGERMWLAPRPRSRRSRLRDGEACAGSPRTGVRAVGVEARGTRAFPE